ncbi:MAG: hypothetical protein FWD61_08415 [Phycisphaerales bacterium]|nr:hypothetical protein [Phycisphaerales bacterium]
MINLMRRYRNVLMAVFTAGLMLVWVIQATIGRNPDRTRTAERGTLNNRKVVGSDLYEAAADMKILSSVVIPELRASLMDLLVARQINFAKDEDDRTLQWFLLLKEATSYGLLPSDAQVSDVLDRLSQVGLSGDILHRQLSYLRVSEKRLRIAIAHALQLQSLSFMSINALVPSLPRVELEADLQLSTADVTVATIEGAKNWEKMPAPTEEQIKKQFETYKSVLPWSPESGTPVPVVAEHRFPFGYKYPDRAKVEYLRFDRAEVARQFSPTAEDEEAAFNYYTNHKKEDPRFTLQASATDVIGPTSQPTTEGGAGYKKWDDVKGELIKDEVAKRVDKLLKKIVDRARTLTEEPWKNVEKTESGYRKEFPQEMWGNYEKIADEIVQNKEFGGFRPSYHAVTGFLSEAELAKLKGIGDAYYESQNRKRMFAMLATRVQELVGTKDPMADLFLQVGPEGQTLRDEDGNYYIYRVTAAEKSHEPANVDEVRNQVIEDLKKIAAYEQAKTMAKDLAEQAKAGDLLELAKKKGVEVELATNVKQGSEAIGKKVGHVPGMIDAIFNLAHEPAATQPTQGEGGKRISPTTTLPKDESFNVYVMELTRYNPVSPMVFDIRRNDLVRLSEQEDRWEFVRSWMSLPAVMERMHFVQAPGASKAHKENDE